MNRPIPTRRRLTVGTAVVGTAVASLATQQVHMCQMKFGLKPRFYTKHNPRQGFTPEFSSWI